MRSKTEYTQITENGKPTIKKLGMAPIQRDGMEYEFTTVFDLSIEHIAVTSKDRTGIFDGKYFKPDATIGHKLLSWLTCDNSSSTNVKITPALQFDPEPVPDIFSENTTELSNRYSIVSSETKKKGNGQVFAKLVLLRGDSHILAWSASTEILDIPAGTVITAKLIERNGTHVIESYTIVKVGEAA